jgi:hypothetical protein
MPKRPEDSILQESAAMEYRPPRLEVSADQCSMAIGNGAGCKCALWSHDGNVGHSSSAGAYEVDE